MADPISFEEFMSQVRSIGQEYEPTRDRFSCFLPKDCCVPGNVNHARFVEGLNSWPGESLLAKAENAQKDLEDAQKRIYSGKKSAIAVLGPARR